MTEFVIFHRWEHSLHRAGLPVVLTETAQPLAVRRRVALAQAVYDGACQVEEVTARLAGVEDALAVVRQGQIPVLVDPQTHSLVHLGPFALVDAIMAKRNTGTRLADAPLVVAGDFNDWGNTVQGALGDAGLVASVQARKATCPSRLPLVQLDHVYVRGLEPLGLHVPRGRIWWRMSDHLPLIAEFKL